MRCDPRQRSAWTWRRASRRRASPASGPRKDPLPVALFVKRARAARADRPNLAARPTPVHPGLLEADAAGRWGTERQFGGRYVPETLVAALEALERAYAALRDDPRFWAELRELLGDLRGPPDAALPRGPSRRGGPERARGAAAAPAIGPSASGST